ncbi:hypothetical protein BK661_14465 [Pseudomonas frederiksbergensis]|uniref:Uncharacterized protein n=1 Tax=Pseudomonas frederiksbergensis TaxID=104087 RepID=A0A423J4T9_9PSED|nr:hypothetical protein [Pseudomonas frederiksbergensis]RON32689.1 hypothetical protein BK661_14465 [Pseudomonas frederiksbergensis]
MYVLAVIIGIGVTVMFNNISCTTFGQLEYLSAPTENSDDSDVGAALVAFFMGVTFSSQTIPAHSIAIFWVCLALTERFTTLSRSLIKRT